MTPIHRAHFYAHAYYAHIYAHVHRHLSMHMAIYKSRHTSRHLHTHAYTCTDPCLCTRLHACLYGCLYACLQTYLQTCRGTCRIQTPFHPGRGLASEGSQRTRTVNADEYITNECSADGIVYHVMAFFLILLIESVNTINASLFLVGFDPFIGGIFICRD